MVEIYRHLLDSVNRSGRPTLTVSEKMVKLSSIVVVATAAAAVLNVKELPTGAKHGEVSNRSIDYTDRYICTYIN